MKANAFSLLLLLPICALDECYVYVAILAFQHIYRRYFKTLKNWKGEMLMALFISLSGFVCV